MDVDAYFSEIKSKRACKMAVDWYLNVETINNQKRTIVAARESLLRGGALARPPAGAGLDGGEVAAEEVPPANTAGSGGGE